MNHMTRMRPVSLHLQRKHIVTAMTNEGTHVYFLILLTTVITTTMTMTTANRAPITMPTT